MFRSTTEWLNDGLNNELATNPYSIYGELDPQNKSLIFESEEEANGAAIKRVKIQNHDSIILFKSNVEKEQMKCFY